MDKTGILVSEVYRVAQTAAKDIANMDTPTADMCIENLEFDVRGNLLVSIYVDGKPHKLSLVRHH